MIVVMGAVGPIGSQVSAIASSNYVTGAVNIRDSMNRTVSTGFGAAELGGRYVTADAPARLFHVAKDGAVIGPILPGTAAAASLPAVSSPDEQLQLAFTLSRRASRGGGEYINLEMRRQANGDAYRARVRVTPEGQMLVGLSRTLNGVDAHLGSTVTLGQRVRDGQTIMLQGFVAGAFPVLLGVRAWVRGTALPRWQATYSAFGNRQLESAGAVGIWAYTSSASAPAVLHITSLTGWALRRLPNGPSQPSVLLPAGGRGSVAVGSAAYAVPRGALFVSPSSGNDRASGSIASPLRTVNAALRRASRGQTIVLRAGVYHEAVFVGSTRSVTIQAFPKEAVWFDGTRRVTNWERRGSTWISPGWTARFDHSASFTRGSNAGGFVNSRHPMAAYPDQVFVDGAQLDQVSASVSPHIGQFSVDTSTNTLTIGSNPMGHTVRASDLGQAFVVAGRVTLRGFGVRGYATALPQMGTVYLGGKVGGDIVQNLVIQGNATQGLAVSTRATIIDHVTSSNNGMTGMQAYRANGSIFENCLMVGNNTQGFNAAPANGGIKVARTRGIVIRDNEVVANNHVNGIWTDVSTTDFVITGNIVAANDGPYGVLTELSDTGIVANNNISGARYGYTAFDTGNVQVFNNIFSHNSVWDVGLSQDARRNPDVTTTSAVPWVVRNIVVANNVFGTAGQFQFYALDKKTGRAASDMNITIDGNVFPRAGGDRQPVMVGWGQSNSDRLAYYRSPAALNAGARQRWSNVQQASTLVVHDEATQRFSSMAVPLPSGLAALIGEDAGTRHIGTF